MSQGDRCFIVGEVNDCGESILYPNPTLESVLNNIAYLKNRRLQESSNPGGQQGPGTILFAAYFLYSIFNFYFLTVFLFVSFGTEIETSGIFQLVRVICMVTFSTKVLCSICTCNFKRLQRKVICPNSSVLISVKNEIIPSNFLLVF